ncbi:hypothetical protein B6A10_00725 [Flavobacterium sp. L1I52]|uniref:ApeA N-terminal domain-containing protein n=1 Tax=Flavobacterium pokkalii TaxID=1940408 RepID=A0ABR7UMP1_9FLAO|nr:HEPN domain-containing protein [Flavobacterium pokkalii]MBD0723696.1 hypothetical protein [Flavobacterium pokkalii]
MNSKFEIKGLWFLPEKKENRIPGTLTFDPINGGNLELIGCLEEEYFFFEQNSSDESQIILGISTESDLITLYDCFCFSRNSKTKINQESGPPSVKYYANFILKGHHFENENSLKFNSIKSSLQNLDEWVNITGFNHSEKYDGIIRLEYQTPQNVEFDLHSGYKGKFTFSTTRPTFNSNKHEYITQITEIQIDSKNEISLEDILKILSRFKNFLVLGIYRSSSPNSIILYNNNIQNDYGKRGKFRKPIELYHTTQNRLNLKEKRHFEMLFNYTQIKDFFPQAIKLWYQKYDNLDAAFNLLFDQFYKGSTFSENTFLNLAQSAETLHSRLYSHTKIPKEEYSKMKKTILETTPTEYHWWIKEQLNFGNNLNLHQRLSELLEKYDHSIIRQSIKDKDKFIKQVKDLRNYYTHYSKSLEKKKITERELMILSEKLKMLLVSGFLFEIGFPKELIESLFKKAKFQLFQLITSE